jgi:hypothetical protein
LGKRSARHMEPESQNAVDPVHIGFAGPPRCCCTLVLISWSGALDLGRWAAVLLLGRCCCGVLFRLPLGLQHWSGSWHWSLCLDLGHCVLILALALASRVSGSEARLLLCSVLLFPGDIGLRSGIFIFCCPGHAYPRLVGVHGTGFWPLAGAQSDTTPERARYVTA